MHFYLRGCFKNTMKFTYVLYWCNVCCALCRCVAHCTGVLRTVQVCCALCPTHVLRVYTALVYPLISHITCLLYRCCAHCLSCRCSPTSTFNTLSQVHVGLFPCSLNSVNYNICFQLEGYHSVVGSFYAKSTIHFMTLCNFFCMLQ